jgi:hypothetical protein
MYDAYDLSVGATQINILALFEYGRDIQAVHTGFPPSQAHQLAGDPQKPVAFAR